MSAITRTQCGPNAVMTREGDNIRMEFNLSLEGFQDWIYETSEGERKGDARALNIILNLINKSELANIKSNIYQKLYDSNISIVRNCLLTQDRLKAAQNDFETI